MAETLHLDLLNQVGELEKLANGLAEFGKAHGLHHRTLYAANLAAGDWPSICWPTPGMTARITFSPWICLHEAENQRELHLAMSDDGLAFNTFEAEDLSPPELSADQA